MIIAKAENNGVDEAILIVQKILDTLQYNDVNIYGRVYRNLRDDNYRAEAYTQNKEYKEIFINDSKGGIFGFYITSRKSNKGTLLNEMDLIFTGDLTKLSGETGRYDEEFLMTVLNLLNNNGISTGEVKTGVDSVFTNFEKDNIKFRDMQPYFVFSIKITLISEIYFNC